MIESLLFIITLFKDIVKTFFAFATKNIYFDRFGRTNGESAVPLRAALFVLPYPFSDTEGGIRKRSCGYKGGCGPAKRRGLWKRKGYRTMHLAKNPSLFKACAAPFAKTARFAQAAAPAFAFCPSGSPTAAPPVLPQNVCPPSCETFVRRLASWRTCVRRAGRGFTSAHEKIGKSGVLSVDGPRGKPSGRRKRKSAKSRRCEAGRPARELPSGGECRPMGNAVRRRFSQAQHGRRQANFVEIRRLKGKLSTYPHGYPQCRRFMP